MEDNEKKGFTLIEILAVIVLIALIVIIAVPSVKSISAKSKRKLFDTKVRIAEEAVNMWAEDNTYCFDAADGCGILDGCVDDINGNKKCTTTFEKLASNGIIEYDLVEGDNKYVVDPTNNESMNKYIIDVILDKNTNLVISNLDESDENKNVSEKIITTKKGEITSFNTKTTTSKTTTSNTITTTKPILCGSFATDSWATIEYNVKHNNTSCYKVGDVKDILLNGDDFKKSSKNRDGIFQVRISNMSSPDVCNSPGFSQTACGFIIEFVDIIFKRQITDIYSNEGGYPKSSVRTYLNSTVLNAMSPDLKNVIANSRVVSSHGLYDLGNRLDDNFESLDKIYLLGSSEVYLNNISYSDNYYDEYYNLTKADSAYSQSRQLDYYKKLGVTTTNYKSIIKNSHYMNEVGSDWSLRTAKINSPTDYIFILDDTGSYLGGTTPTNTYLGVSPAFRIGEDGTSSPSNLLKPVVQKSKSNFENDNWSTIVNNIRKNNSSIYKVGDEKEIIIDGKSYTVRIANNSTPSKCSTSGFSQTACGFVVEFVDVYESRQMNDVNMTTSDWSKSLLYQYLNGSSTNQNQFIDSDGEKKDTLYNKLPEDLKKYIIDTKIVTHSYSTTAKLYLLSFEEIKDNYCNISCDNFDKDNNVCKATCNSPVNYNSLNSRRLDFYSVNSTISDRWNYLKKDINNNFRAWWLRSFYGINRPYDVSNGRVFNGLSTYTNYVAPAFRIG